MIDVVIVVSFIIAPGAVMCWNTWREERRRDFEYWLNCDVDRHVENELLSEAMETQFTNTGMTKLEVQGASAWRVRK